MFGRFRAQPASCSTPDGWECTRVKPHDGPCAAVPNYEHFPQFPHCDAKILHSPGVCVYCDEHPDWQAYRLAAGVNFSDTDDPQLAPCPSTHFRSGEIRDRWYGNVPK